MKNFLKHSRAGFTLVELLIAMTIMSIMGAMTILVYFNVTENSRRLQMAREISETARQITERIAQDVRENGIFVWDAESDTQWRDGDFSASYSADGANILHIKKTDENADVRLHSYYYGKKDGTAVSSCSDEDKKNPAIHCGLYVWKDGEFYNLVDAFRTDDSKRVKITDLKFFISGDETTESKVNAAKVTLKMTLQLMPREWVPPSLVSASKMEIQTTFSERPYKIK